MIQFKNINISVQYFWDPIVYLQLLPLEISKIIETVFPSHFAIHSVPEKCKNLAFLSLVLGLKQSKMREAVQVLLACVNLKVAKGKKRKHISV